MYTLNLENLENLTQLSNLNFQKEDISSVILPRNISKIPSYCFSNFINLKTIQRQSNIQNIENNAFENCSSLLSLYLNKVEYINDNAFLNCSSLNLIKGLYKYTYIADTAFNKCINLSNIIDCNNYHYNNIESFFNIVNNKLILEDDSLEDNKKDIALIECFFGNNIDVIINTGICIKKILNTININKIEWIFIEAQKDQKESCFNWVQNYGIKYIFKKIPEESKGLWLKMPLWNIGAMSTECNKLCFIDSNIYFENNNWLNIIDKALDNYDIISLAGFINNNGKIIETFAHKILSNNIDNIEDNLIEPTIGMTRKAYEEYGHFDAVNYLDDQWFWMTIVGYKNCKSNFILPYYPNDKYQNGYPFNIGSTEESCIYLGSTDKLNTFNLAHDISYDNINYPMQDIIYDKKTDKIPIWSNNNIGKIMKKCFNRLFDNTADEYTYYREAKKLYEEIDENNPLIIVTIWKPDFTHKDIHLVINHKNMLDKYCSVPFTYLCFSNEEIPGIDIIPYDSNENNILNIIHNKKVQYPDNAIIKYIDIDQKITKRFTVFKNI